MMSRSKSPTGSQRAADKRGRTLANSANMSQIRSRDTTPEIRVRRKLHAKGFRFRLHRPDLPGKPDIVLARYRTAVFVHGCFWHQHENCNLASKPKTKTEYWTPKLARNLQRDIKAKNDLLALGWRVQIIWECDTRKPERLEAKLNDIITGLELWRK